MYERINNGSTPATVEAVLETSYFHLANIYASLARKDARALLKILQILVPI